MRVPRSFRVVGVWVMLTVAWCALWGSFSAANMLAGAALSVVVIGSGVGPPARGRIRLVPLARLAALVVADLVRSTAGVARSILSNQDRVEEAIVAVRLPESAKRHLLLLICAVTVTPGTAVVDADPDTGTLYLHLLHLGERAAVEEHVRELAELADAALPGRTAASQTQSPSSRGGR